MMQCPKLDELMLYCSIPYFLMYYTMRKFSILHVQRDKIPLGGFDDFVNRLFGKNF